MDNLNIHKHAMILDLIEDGGHRVVFRAPYWSCDGLIEYVFNTIHVKLQMEDDGPSDGDTLMQKLDETGWPSIGQTKASVLQWTT